MLLEVDVFLFILRRTGCRSLVLVGCLATGNYYTALCVELGHQGSSRYSQRAHWYWRRQFQSGIPVHRFVSGHLVELILVSFNLRAILDAIIGVSKVYKGWKEYLPTQGPSTCRHCLASTVVPGHGGDRSVFVTAGLPFSWPFSYIEAPHLLRDAPKNGGMNTTDDV